MTDAEIDNLLRQTEWPIECSGFEIANLLQRLVGTIKTLRTELNEAKAVITEANNSLYGSQGYFLSLNGGPPDKYHLATGIENSKAYGRRQWQETQRLTDALLLIQNEVTTLERQLDDLYREKAYT